MLDVYFERKSDKSTVHIATFDNEEHYHYAYDALKDMATALGYDKVSADEPDTKDVLEDAIYQHMVSVHGEDKALKLDYNAVNEAIDDMESEE